MEQAHAEDWSPFGRGWTTASLTAVTMLVLVLARQYGAGGYGAGAVPFLFLFFLVTGVVAGRATASLLAPLWRLLRLPAAVVAACVAVVVVFQTWNTRPSGEPLLVPMFLVIVVPAIAWAVAAPARERNGARATAAAAAAALLLAQAAGL